MLAHTLQHPLGLLHLLVAVAAIAAGAAVLAAAKGTPSHRWSGRVYLGAMVAVNLSALLIYELFDGFGAFHWLALASLATVLAGYGETLIRRPGWVTRHAYYMSGSYIGLIAALAAEVLTRTPLLPFFEAVLLASVGVISAGMWLMFRLVPATVRSMQKSS